MRNINRSIIILVGAALLLGAVVLLPASQPATAQYSEGDLRQLLTTLWERVLTEQANESYSNFVFSVSFDSSIAGLGNSVTFGQGLENLQLREVGTNYMCIARKFSRTTNVDCIPYTNIIKISYTER
ncbi:MAG: hypothetical protein Kow0077_02170 [Anaerolineae bacterium]